MVSTTPIRTVPHFSVRAAGGATVDYARDVWQRKNLVLIAVPEGTDERGLADAYAPVAADDTRLVVTSAPVDGVPAPAILIADQWGEIAHSETASTVDELPDPGEVGSWVEHVRHRCPECEGEAR